MIRTIARGVFCGLGVLGLAVSAAVIAGAAIADHWGRDHDRRAGGDR